MRCVAVVLLVFCIQAIAQSNHMSRRVHPFAETASELRSTYIHGTIDVMVATKEGFVLATNSRATSHTGSSEGFNPDSMLLPVC